MKLNTLIIFQLGLLFAACADNNHYTGSQAGSSGANDKPENKVMVYKANSNILTGNTQPAALISYAESLIGTPYKYGSIDPNQGFDCSGFITYVFNHFGISVPRSSNDFTNINKSISLRNSKPGDLILFTGTDSTKREVGHMGIITENNGQDIQFIHSTSGKIYGVTITPLNKYYQGRFFKAIRVFKSND